MSATDRAREAMSALLKRSLGAEKRGDADHVMKCASLAERVHRAGFYAALDFADAVEAALRSKCTATDRTRWIEESLDSFLSALDRAAGGAE